MEKKKYYAEWDNMAAAGSYGSSRRTFMQSVATAGVSLAIAGSVGSATQAAGPKKGGELRLGADGGSSTDTLDPTQALGADHATSATFATFDTLTEINHEGNPEPSLAESWEGSRDGTWAIKLRKGVEFHDGKSLTANDVVWSLNQHRGDSSKNAEARQIVGNMEEIRADGPDTVIIKQKEVNFDLPSLLSSFGLLIGKEGTRDWNKGVGTGPYVMEEWEPGVRYTGRRFKNFYREDQGYFETILSLNVADSAARASGLLSGSFDVIGSPDVQIAKRLSRATNLELIQVSGTQHYTTDMRTDSGPLADPHIRNAVKWGVKRQEIIDKVLGGFATIGNDIPLARNQKFYNNQIAQREFDPDKSRWHLKQAGLNSVDLTFHTSDGAFAGAVDIGILMQQSLAKADVNLTVKREPADGYWSEVWMKKPWSASYYNGRPTADWMLTSQYSSSSKWDATYFKNAQFDALLSQARSMADEEKRRELYFEAQKLLWEEGGALVIAFVNILMAANRKLGHGNIGVSRRLDDGRLARRWWFNA